MRDFNPLPVEKSLEASHKEANTRFAAPILVTNFTLVLILSYNPSPKYWIAVALNIVAFAFNVAVVKLNPTVGSLRNERMDALRWVINYLFIDTHIALTLGSSIDLIFFFWLTALIGSFIETYGRRYRIPITALGFVCSIGTLLYLFPQGHLTSVIGFLTTAVAVLAFIYFIERSWMNETSLRLLTQERESDLKNQSAALYISAMAGENTKMIAHEVNNMITAINFATNNPNEIRVENIKVSLQYVKQACELIMSEISANKKLTSLKKIVADVELLLRKQVESRGIEWGIEGFQENAGVNFLERTGSCYFILQNFIQNAIRIVETTRKSQGKIKLSFKRENDQLLICVFDNGPGIEDEVRDRLLRGEGKTLEKKQHGIGVQFVLIECERNGFTFIIERLESDEYKTMFAISIPLS